MMIFTTIGMGMGGVHVLDGDWRENCSVVGDEKHLTMGVKDDYRQRNGETCTKAWTLGQRPGTWDKFHLLLLPLTAHADVRAVRCGA
jgi:hypothetical protein